MRAVFGLVLIVGLGLAGFAVYMAKNYIDGYQRQLEAERQQRAPVIETVDIFVATRALQYGEALDKDAVRLTAFPKTSLHAALTLTAFAGVLDDLPQASAGGTSPLNGKETLLRAHLAHA